MKLRYFNRGIAIGMFVLAIVKIGTVEGLVFLCLGWSIINNCDIDLILEKLKIEYRTKEEK